MATYKDATFDEVDVALKTSWKAFKNYRKLNLKDRAQFLYTIAAELDAATDDLVGIADKETHLGTVRLKGELKRTIFQLTAYGQACEEGTWLDIRIDTADSNRTPPKPDLRKMLVPLGPVVVFGASNFPFAYSTAGGDTACALAAGCSVLLKAHPAHAGTSEMVAGLVSGAAKKCGLPEGVFIHLHGAGFETGTALVQHPLTKAVSFTGSYEGGKALFELANKRPVPIPVFAEMGSVNPVFLLPQKLRAATEEIAAMYATSITLGGGQFCTNPGLLIAIDDDALTDFKKRLGNKLAKVEPVTMLHSGIAKSFHRNREKMLAEDGVTLTAVTEFEAEEEQTIPTLAEVDASVFLQNQLLHKEVFGPFSLLIKCRSMDQMLELVHHMEGQLTANLLATDEEVKQYPDLVEGLKDICGRLVLNGAPTGVEVALAMHHGGPYPATTDSRFTSVGADGIKRFARPVCFQNWSPDLLPPELKNENPLQLWRTVNNALTNDPIG